MTQGANRSSGAKACEECAHHGRHVKATTAYICAFDHSKVHVCASCYDKNTKLQAKLIATGPYTHQTETGIGHKGGASEDMAKLLCGSRAAEARKALISILKTPMTAEDASRKAGLDPDYGSPRLSELLKNGLVATHDRKGVSDRGNPCGRYIITDLAKGLAA